MDKEEKAIELTKAACLLMESRTKSVEVASSWAVDIFECVLAELEKKPEERHLSLSR